jgi:SAM-dependent methyltransferase
MDLTEKTENLKRHPWELSRSHNILKLLSKYDNNCVYADIGAGDKFFTLKLLSITSGNVYAVDNEYYNDEGIENGIYCLNDIKLLENNSIDVLILMDVLEHIENANLFLKEALYKLKPNGKIIITVPAMQFLFSSHDVFLKHYRRYSKMQLNSMLEKHDIIIEKSYYFYTTLFILRCIISFFEIFRLNKVKKSVGVGMWDYSETSIVTRSIFYILNIDFFINGLLSKIHIYLPGLSLLAACRKKA